MDLIKLSSLFPSLPTTLSIGEAVEGYKSVLWVERYRGPGEFKIEAPLSSGLMDLLPLGSFITHLKTSVVMIVENFEIKAPKGEDPTLLITGRCFTSYLEQRTVGDTQAFLDTQIIDYVAPSDQTWDQVVELIDSHLIDSVDPNAELDGVEVNHACTGSATVEERVLRQVDILQVVTEILKVDDLGIKSVRPTPTDPLTYFTVYRGNDVSTKVRFSSLKGDLDNVEYFFSNKKLKNHARIMGRWVQTIYNPAGTDNYDRRVLLVDASYVDERQTGFPGPVPLALIVAAMQIIGDQALKAQKGVSITQADVSDNTKFQYRTDYNLGDLVTVDGDFGSSAVMRVIEYAEADDENGFSGHPTLAIPGEV